MKETPQEDKLRPLPTKYKQALVNLKKRFSGLVTEPYRHQKATAASARRAADRIQSFE